MGGALFWAIFSQTHLATLFAALAANQLDVDLLNGRKKVSTF
jgi:hypothetical protein